jgi:hypothetical protein
MDDIRVLIVRLGQIAVSAVVILLCLFTSIKPDPQHYYHGSLLKLELLRKTPSPRIILVGGSNIAWGIDSQLIEQSLGIPVVNDGLDVHIGIVPLLEVQEYIHPGDIIIISLEYYNFAGGHDFYGGPQYLADWIEFSPQRIKYLKEPFWDSLPMLHRMLQRKIHRQMNLYFYGENLSEFRGIYQSKYFNEYGDFVGHLQDKKSPEISANYGGFLVNQNDEAYAFLEAFHLHARSQGALVFYEAPAARLTNCELTGMKYIHRFYRLLQTQTTIPLLTNADHLCYPDEYFYDTPFHLNAQGREIRTQHLIANLKTALEVP